MQAWQLATTSMKTDRAYNIETIFKFNIFWTKGERMLANFDENHVPGTKKEVASEHPFPNFSTMYWLLMFKWYLHIAF